MTAAQLSRRRFMQSLLASGALAAGAGVLRPGGVFAQDATPAATPIPPFSGELAADQEMRLPITEPTTMDPGVSYGDDELSIFYNIFDGLIGIDQQTGEVVPRVAESYEANADASEYTFHIRQGVTWSDGTPLTSQDFLYSWKRVLDPNTLSQYIPALYPIKNAEKIANGEADISEFGVAAPDDSTLVVTLEGPTTFFPLLATTWTYFPVPKHVIDEKAEAWVEAENIVSNGPYKMTEWSHNQQIVLERNDSYYGDKPTITKATYRLYEDDTLQAYTSFENNELDYAEPGGPDLERILADPTLSAELIQFPLSNTYFIIGDTTNPPTDKVEFRQALNKSVDRETLASTVFKGEYLPAASMLPPNIPGNNPAAALPESVDEAKQLLSSAGIDPSSINIELAYRNVSPYKTLAEFLQSSWQEALGIAIKLTPIEDNAYSDWRAARAETKFNLYTGVWGSDFADASNWFNQNFTTSADHYQAHWSNAEFDQLVETAITNTNTEERNEQYSQAEVILVRESPVIPVMRGKAFRAVKPWVKDIYFQPLLSVVHLRTVKIAAH
ncbi:MAG TPA: peptide ABC transporter substrate-binding protein [Thermomicrobiales bacterium]|nr:peptide ABC transporter substrate-binding protein [Thermomicrobiales bacterium]